MRYTPYLFGSDDTECEIDSWKAIGGATQTQRYKGYQLRRKERKPRKGECNCLLPDSKKMLIDGGKKKKRTRYQESVDTETPIDDPQAPKGQPKKKKSVSTPKQKEKSASVSPQYSISDFTFNNGAGEGNSKQGSRTKNAAQSKTKKRVNPEYDDEGYDTEVPVDEPIAPKGQSKKKKPISNPKQKVKSPPVSPPMSPQYSISGFTFNNDSGNMTNMNVGNILQLNYHGRI